MCSYVYENIWVYAYVYVFMIYIVLKHLVYYDYVVFYGNEAHL